MQNLSIDNMAPEAAEKQAKEKAKPKSALHEEIKFLIDNMHYQDKEIRGDTYFISSRDLEGLPDLICELVEK